VLGPSRRPLRFSLMSRFGTGDDGSALPFPFLDSRADFVLSLLILPELGLSGPKDLPTLVDEDAEGFDGAGSSEACPWGEAWASELARAPLSVAG
jgi:hypothetical protein